LRNRLANGTQLNSVVSVQPIAEHKIDLYSKLRTSIARIYVKNIKGLKKILKALKLILRVVQKSIELVVEGQATYGRWLSNVDFLNHTLKKYYNYLNETRINVALVEINKSNEPEKTVEIYSADDRTLSTSKSACINPSKSGKHPKKPSPCTSSQFSKQGGKFFEYVQALIRMQSLKILFFLSMAFILLSASVCYVDFERVVQVFADLPSIVITDYDQDDDSSRGDQSSQSVDTFFSSLLYYSTNTCLIGTVFLVFAFLSLSKCLK
jgi:hypothetical protein